MIDFLWYHPRAAAVPGRNGPEVVLTLQKHLQVSDYYSGLFVLERESLQGAWRGPTAVPELDWRQEPDGVTISVADVTTPARRLGPLRPHQQHQEPLRHRGGGGAHRPLAEDPELLGRRRTARRGELLRGAPHELLRCGGGV